MITIDTNILVRIFVDDNNKKQVVAARKLSKKEGKVYIPQVVQIEFVWILEGPYKFNKSEVLSALLELYQNDAFHIQHEDNFFEAYKLYKEGNIEFSDCLILAESKAHNASKVYTFDKKFSRLPGVTVLA